MAAATGGYSAYGKNTALKLRPLGGKGPVSLGFSSFSNTKSFVGSTLKGYRELLL